MTEAKLGDLAMTKPGANGADKAFPKRNPSGLIPATWLERGARVVYVGASGRGVETTCKLLGVCPIGLMLGVGGGRMLLSWDRFVLLELVER